MNELRYTLLSDGSSDRALIPLLTWLLQEKGISSAIQGQWADLRRLTDPPKRLSERISSSVYLYPCDLLFIHRDAEKESLEKRVAEIRHALAAAKQGEQMPRAVCVVPVRMQEAWLLFDEQAIRHAAGNPQGKEPLNLPHISTVESHADPKEALYSALRTVSGLQGRRLRSFKMSIAVQRVAERIDDFSPLRQLSAFRHLEHELAAIVDQYGWNDVVS